MNRYAKTAAMLLVLGVAAAGCRGGGGTPAALPAALPTAAPATNPAAVSEGPAEQPLAPPEEGLAYLNNALKDKTRLIEVFDTDKGFNASLDDTGRKKLRKEVPKWWNGVVAAPQKPKPGQSRFRVTPDLGIRIYPPGSAGRNPKDPREYADPRAALLLEPAAEIFAYRSRQISRVRIVDPAAGRLTEPVFIIPSTAPMDWLNRLFAGKL